MKKLFFTKFCPNHDFRWNILQRGAGEGLKVIEGMYPTLVKSGKITFRALNLDDASSKAAAEKCSAEGQSLLVIGGGKRIDLTS